MWFWSPGLSEPTPATLTVTVLPKRTGSDASRGPHVATSGEQGEAPCGSPPR